jgi:hypothetical protein
METGAHCSDRQLRKNAAPRLGGDSLGRAPDRELSGPGDGDARRILWPAPAGWFVSTGFVVVFLCVLFRRVFLGLRG